MVSKKLNKHITDSYSRWSDYAEYHANLAGIPDESGDILNEVLLALMQKDPKQTHSLLAKKKGPFTELDFFVLKMIKLNAHSMTSPYRHKTRDVPKDLNVDPLTIERPLQSEEDSNTEVLILEKCRMAREILENLSIPGRDKEIFSWRFFADNSLRSWPGDESYSVVCNTFNRVKRQMIRKIKNPHSTRRRWTKKEIRYLKAEFPHIETMKIAVYLNRNYDSVRIKAQELGLKKTDFTKRKIRRKAGKKTLCNSATKGKG